MLPVFKIVITDETEMLVNSFVDVPAHLHAFIANKNLMKFELNEEKREVFGVVIAANQPIYYYSDEIPECYIIFDEKSIKLIAENYFANNRQNLIDIDHDYKIRENAVVMLESYFTDDEKKSPFNVEPGSWVMRYAIKDNEIWQKIKSGEVNGFSIAGNFGLEKLNFNNKMNMKTKTLKEKILAILQMEEPATMVDVQTVDGKKMQVENELAVGNKLYAIAEDGSSILAPKGDYVVLIDEKQKKVVVDELGVIVAIEEIAPAAEPEAVTQEIINSLKDELNTMRADYEKQINEMKSTIEMMAVELSKKMKFRKPENHEQNQSKNKNVIIN